MAGKKFYSFNNLLTAIIERVSESDKEECKKYVNETLVKCGKLCENGKEVGALTEVKHMLLNLKKEFEL